MTFLKNIIKQGLRVRPFNLEKEQFNINDLLADVAKDYTERIRSDNKNIELIYDQKDANRPILVKVDRGRITQVISNIFK